ncbi:MAG: hypothetical protein Q7K57_51770 [Burkholderiaceae bacterium]|nr:hypothetical protein [Burkholderiaceae bacterium]
MKERPILFNGPMVRALLSGGKTQTRRIVKGAEQWPANAVKAVMLETRGTAMAVDAQRYTYSPEIKCPYGMPGDRLWVRETHAPQSDCWGAWERSMQYGSRQDSPIIHFAADESIQPFIEKWRPSIHMPRWASRITLEIVSVRVERLQDISEADAIAEGVYPDCGCRQDDDVTGFYRVGPVRGDSYPIARYAALWESINGQDSWDANPWIWAIEFKRITP